MVRKLFSLCLAGLLPLVSAQAELYDVNIISFSFQPAELTIAPGDTVRWTNNDAAPHTATATGGEFDSGNLDYGQSYSHAFLDTGSFAYVCLYHSNMTGVIHVGTGGGGGEGWTEQQSPTTLPLNDVRFWDAQLGWIAGDAGILRTTNGGELWTLTPTGDDAEAVFFVPASDGWACGNDGMLLHSTTGGGSWQSQNSGVGEKLRDIWFADMQNGWAVGRDGILIHTTSGGMSWTPQSSPATDDLRGIHMHDAQRGWICGSDGLILYTSNGGASWQIQLSVPGGEEDEFEAVFAYDENLAWTAGGQGRIYATTDGGESWLPQSSGTNVALMDIFFTSPDSGWVCGAGGFLAATTDGGEVWQVQEPPAFASFDALFFVRPDLGWTVTADGRIFRYSAQPSGAEPRAGFSNPARFQLRGNYPNPFNASTTIVFDLHRRASVELDVFDAGGRVVSVLVLGELEPGVHAVPFATEGLSSGAYFYRLAAAGSSQARPMLLIK